MEAQVGSKQHVGIDSLLKDISVSVRKREDFIYTKPILIGDKKLKIYIRATCKNGKFFFNCEGISQYIKRKERILTRRFLFIQWCRIMNLNVSFIFMGIKRSLEQLNIAIDKEFERK